MKKLFYFLFFNFNIWNYGYSQIFTENFETFDPRYGTNVINAAWQCPSISFRTNNLNIDCLANWRTLAGTPALVNGPKNICGILPVAQTSYLSMWSGRTDSANTIGEAAYTNAISLLPNTAYSITYLIQVLAPAKLTDPVPTSAEFNIRLANNLNPFYYTNQGNCGTQMPNIDNTFNVDNYSLDVMGKPWKQRTINFTTDNNLYNQVLFFPTSKGRVNTQINIQIDDITIVRCNYKTSLNNIIYNDFNTALPFQSIAQNQIYANGSVVINSIDTKEFIAGNEVRLDSDFTVEEGANFEAKIEQICSTSSISSDDIFVYIPNIMTRNCDGVGDTWVVMDGNRALGPLYTKGFNLKIYNRWGNMVHSETRYQSSTTLFGGDIQWNGAGVPNGVYYYELELYNCYDDLKLYKGTISILGDCQNGKSISNIEEKEFDKISTYPNPSTGQFIISAPEAIDKVVIYNSFGEEVKANIANLDDKTIQVDVTDHKVGIYLIRLRSGNEWMDKKIVIE